MERLRFVCGIVLLVVVAQSCNMYKSVDVLEVQQVRVKEFSDEKIVAEVDLLIDNPNSFKVKLIKSEIDLQINGAHVGKMELGEKLKIPRKSKETQTITIQADTEELKTNFLQNFLTLLFNPKVKLKAEGFMKGRALFVPKKVPLLIEKDIDAGAIDLGN